MEKLTLNNSYSGFKVNRITYVPELKANLYEMEHEKSGAKTLYIDRDDDNKVFAIGFKTTPEDDTGVFHILEHSVLCGSKNYPVKEPFVDLLKSSMATFLNAMTFPDKTVYPFASCNDRDFANLMGVYLDAVFNPNIHTCEEIFMQEGWHYEVSDKDEPLTYRGVVFNEMKGSYSSVDTCMFAEIDKAIFPDTCYRFSSGGDPASIPNLTYDQFIAAHKKYYHPENSFIYLYGNMDIEERLAYIDREYLSAYTRTDNVIDIAIQAPVVNMDHVGTYSISESDSLDKNSYIAFSSVIGTYADRERILAFDILLSALTSSNEAPLKKAMLESGMCTDMFAFTYDGIAQPHAVIEIRKTDADKKDEFLALLTSELEKYVREGVDRKALMAEINQAEFHLREGKQGGIPAGLSYGLELMSSWLYGGAPETYLMYEEALSNIRDGVENGYFEDLIKDYLLNAEHKVTVVLNPSKTLGDEQAKAEADRLAAYRASLSDADMDALIEKNKKLVEHQMKADTPEQTATLPTLAISDVNPEIMPIECENTQISGTPMLYTNINTNKIVYLNYFFNLDCLEEKYLPYAPLYAELLGQLATKGHTAADLIPAIKTTLGSFSTFVRTYTDRSDIDRVTPMLVGKTSILEASVPQALSLISEIFTSTLLDKEDIKKIVMQNKFGMQMQIAQNGNSYAMTRVNSYSGVEGKYAEIFGGISYYRFLCELCEKIDSDFDTVKEGLEAVAATLTSDRLTLGLTGEESAYNAVAAAYDPLPAGNPREKAASPTPSYTANEAFIVPSGVNYDVKGFNFIKAGVPYSGKMQVLSKIITLDYLWNEVRVRGGAYGTGLVASYSGNMQFYSYRDPQVANTVSTYDACASYITNFADANPDITKYVISTVAGYDKPLCPRDFGMMAQENTFRKVTTDSRRKTRDELLSTTVEDIRSYADVLALLAKEGRCATVGNKDKIADAGDLFGIKEEI